MGIDRTAKFGGVFRSHTVELPKPCRCGPVIALDDGRAFVAEKTPGRATWLLGKDLTWASGPELPEDLDCESLTRLSDGAALALGWASRPAYILDLDEMSWRQIEAPDVPMFSHTVTALGDGTALLAGGLWGEDRPVKECEIFELSSTAWAKTGSLRRGFDPDGTPASAVRLTTNRVLLVSGKHAELYNANSRRWVYAGRPDAQTGWVAATGDGGAITYRGELFDPFARRWTTIEGGYRSGGPMFPFSDGNVYSFSKDGLEAFSPSEKAGRSFGTCPPTFHRAARSGG